MKNSLFSALLALAFIAGNIQANEEPFEKGLKMMQEGRNTEAFRSFLEVPGAEHLAVKMARPKAAEFLALLPALSAKIPTGRLKLIEGDLHLALGNITAALQCYRMAATNQSPDQYPAEPSSPRSPGYRSERYSTDTPALAFGMGPGSHRDNWLIRRFIALDAWDDAAREFARIWTFHRNTTQPHVETRIFPYNPPVTNRMVVTPCGFNGQALQFAIDYAFFLKQRGDTNAALSLLTEPLLAMDMDRMPSGTQKTIKPGQTVDLPERVNSVLMRFWSRHCVPGIARKEFIRLAYGEFKSAGQTNLLTGLIQQRIDGGTNRLRRVLARIRMHEGKTDEALALELAYLEALKASPYTMALRKGRLYEDVGRLSEAATEYETSLTLPATKPLLPDPDEDTLDNERACQMGRQRLAGFDNSPSTGEVLRLDSLERLERLYSAMGNSDRAMDTSLRRLELSESEMGNLERLKQTLVRFRTAGKEPVIMAWLAHQASQPSTKPRIRANLYWLLGKQENTIKAIAEIAARPEDNTNYYRDNTILAWKETFLNAGHEPYRKLLKALLAANPQDMQTLLEWLDIQDQLNTPEVIPILEKLLNGKAFQAFPSGKGTQNRTHFCNYADLAYRLIRLYEQHPCNEDKLLALGFRILEGKAPPFTREESTLSNYRANWNNSVFSETAAIEDTLRCLYVFFAHLKNPDDIKRAALLAEKTGCIPLINQVNRLIKPTPRPRMDPVSGHRVAYDTTTVHTAGLPDGVRLFSNRDDVRAIAPGAQWDQDSGRIWIGTSWGLVRYLATGKTLDILQLPTGAGITSFCETPAGLFVGTKDGLFRMEAPWSGKPKLVRIGIEKADGKRRDRTEWTTDVSGETRTDKIHEAFPVDDLVWWGNALWIESNEDIYRFTPGTSDSFFLGKGGLITGCGKLWGKTSVYDPDTGEFKPIQVASRQWHIIGSTDHEIWADTYVDDQLRHRPALLDPSTLSFTVLPISGLAPSGELMNSDFRLLGETNGQVWLSGNNPDILVTYDRSGKVLRKATGPVPAVLASKTGNSVPDILTSVKLTLSGDRGPRYTSIPLPGNRVLVGASIIREWQEDNLGYDDNSGMSHHVQDLEGGLFLVDPVAGTWNKIGSQDEELSDFYVKRCVRHDNRLYVCSNGGVTIISLPDGIIIGRITVSDGLPSNKVEDIARIGNRLYLACELGDDGGGLAIMDLTTGLIQTLSMADGLKCNKIKGLRADGNRLHILYGTIYAPRAYGTPMEKSVAAPIAQVIKNRYTSSTPDERVRTFSSSILDTKTGMITEGTELLPETPPPNLCGSEMPILGGYTLVSNLTAGTSTILAGTHGMLMFPTASNLNLTTPLWQHAVVKIARSTRQEQIDEAKARPAPEDLEAALSDPNPFYRARAAAGLLGKEANLAAQAPALIRMLASPEIRERCTALFMLGRATPTPAMIKAFEKSLTDKDASVRGFAAIQLCLNGRIPDLDILRNIIQRHDYGNFPFGIDSTIGVVVNRDYLYTALAPRATAPIVRLMMESPPPVSDNQPHDKLLDRLATSLNAHPDIADVLLQAHNNPNSSAQIRFATAVFGYAGTNQLPRLHKALSSKDRIIRSNAARACGAIGNPTSIPHLIKALDLESGLARASIVIALGELKAKEAMPRLTELYIDAQNDEKRRRGSGFMVAQSGALQQAQYDSIRNVDSLSSDWNEIKELTVEPGSDPRNNEELLSPEIILEAVAKIGPDAGRDFYRMLAGGKDTDGRQQAAIQLAGAKQDDRAKNVEILKNLLTDTEYKVRISAAVSLLLLEEQVAHRPLLDGLEGGDRWSKGNIIQELCRVTNHSQLEFARKAIQSFSENPQNHEDLRETAKTLLK